MKRVNGYGLEIQKTFEGLGDGNPLTAKLDPYLCPAGVWTIGYGHAISIDGRFLAGPGDRAAAMALYPGGITAAEAEALLWADNMHFSILVDRLIKPPTNDNQFSALVCLAYNIGVGRFSRSDTLACLNRGDYWGAANNFKWWRKVGGQIMPGLMRRRAAEKALFLGDIVMMNSFIRVEPDTIRRAAQYLGFV